MTLTPDPLRGFPTAPQSLNRYAYARNNPVNRMDPTGLLSEGGPSMLTIDWVDFLDRLSSCPDADFFIFGSSALVAGLYTGNPWVMAAGALSFYFGWYIYHQSCVPPNL